MDKRGKAERLSAIRCQKIFSLLEKRNEQTTSSWQKTQRKNYTVDGGENCARNRVYHFHDLCDFARFSVRVLVDEFADGGRVRRLD